MTSNPDADLRTLRAVHAAAVAGRHAEASTLAEAALANGLEHPLLFNLAALSLEQTGRVEDAVALLERAVAIAPADLGSRNALGLCLLRLERPEDALAQFEALLEIDASVSHAHTGRGNALLALGHIAAADESFTSALAIDPRQGIALAGRAHIAVSRGIYPQAREFAERALAVLPGYPGAVISLAAAELGERALQRAEARILTLLTDVRLAPDERALANGLLGDILDADNRPADAFQAYTACNEELRRTYAPRFGGAPGALDYVRSMARFVEQSGPAHWASPGGTGADRSGVGSHVFLLGFPRSGTTLIEVILEGHPNVVSLEEKESLIDAVREFMRTPQDLDRLARATPGELQTLRAAYWQRVAATGLNVQGKIFLDKHPLNTLKLPLIARLFPAAKILFACRDPRDVVLSCFRHRFAMSAPFYELLTLEGTAHYYAAVMQFGVDVIGRLALDTCLVRHEDVITEFAREMKRICAFLGLEWAPAMGDFALRTRARGILTPSTAQLVRGLNTEGLGQWRRYRTQLAPILGGLEPWIKRFYYDA